jgi:predicted 3-demethylubiquinone-9 3-methyltransferase (glyoxalase superfamily)
MANIIQQKITPFLWFSAEAGEAMDFYCPVFKNSKISSCSKAPNGQVFSGTIEIEG